MCFARWIVIGLVIAGVGCASAQRGAPAVEAAEVVFGLAAGKIHGDETWLRKYFKKQRWELWTPTMIRAELRAFRDSKYENSVASVVAKLLLRGTTEEEGCAEE